MTTSPAIAPAGPSTRRRGCDRSIITRGVFAVPILPDGAPDSTGVAEGIVCEVGTDEIVVELSQSIRPAAVKWFFGIEDAVGDFSYSAVRVTSAAEAGIGVRLTAVPLPASLDPLRESNLRPVFDAQEYRFRTRMPLEMISRWMDLGVVTSRVLDRVLVCPECHALPTFRRGCRACTSIEVESEQLIHHFACAHVERKGNFDAGGQINCPKCRARCLIIGADFEYLQGPFVCRDCRWSDIELATIGRCAACAHEFSETQAFEQEVIGYNVERLEPLALVAQF